MGYIILAILIWVVAAFIYSKVKNKDFLSSFIAIPVCLFKVILEESESKARSYKSKAKKMGNSELEEKFSQQEAAAKQLHDNLYGNSKDE